MSITSGFYNSINGDRRYNAQQMSSIFDGIINDGIFSSVGTAFMVEADTVNTVKVGIGRAWFNSTWIYNDAPLYITADISEVLLDRYDAVIIDIDHTEAVRAADIKIIKGTPATTPQYPTLIDTTHHHQYPLAYIYRKAGSSEITQANIMSVIGMGSTPYVTGILQVQNIDNIVAQWMAQWEEWTSQRQNDFNTWFTNMQTNLGDDAAVLLLGKITAIENGSTTVGKAMKDGEGNIIHNSYAKNKHSHSKTDITDFPTTYTASDITAGTVRGKVLANATAVGDTGSKQIRNIYAGTSDMVPGSTALPTGDIYVMYE